MLNNDMYKILLYLNEFIVWTKNSISGGFSGEEIHVQVCDVSI